MTHTKHMQFDSGTELFDHVLALSLNDLEMVLDRQLLKDTKCWFGLYSKYRGQTWLIKNCHIRDDVDTRRIRETNQWIEICIQLSREDLANYLATISNIRASTNLSDLSIYLTNSDSFLRKEAENQLKKFR